MSTLVNHVRRAFYRDSVALMRISRAIGTLAGVEAAALMIGSANNRKLMQDAGLLAAEGQAAGANDLVLAVRADTAANAEAALAEAARLLEAPAAGDKGGDAWTPKSLDTALAALPGANLALAPRHLKRLRSEFVASEFRRIDNDRRLGTAHPIPGWFVMPTAPVARQLATAIARRRREAVITGHGRAFVFVHRHAPWRTTALIRRFGIGIRGELSR